MANRIAGITVEIGGDTTKLSSALKSVNTEIKSTQSQLKDVNSLLKLDPSNTTLLTQKQKDLSSAIESTKEKLNTLETAAEQANEQLQKGEITQEQYDALQREIIETKQDLESLADQAAESNATLQKIDAVGTKFEETGEKISSTGSKLTKTATAAVVGLGTAAVTTAASFESSMSQVQATMGITKNATSELNGESVNTMDALSDLAQQLGGETAFSASECAEALNYLALAGYDTQEMCDTLPTVLNLAAAGDMELATASDMVTDAMSALGMNTSEAGTMVDQMAKTASSTNTSVTQLGEGILKIGATAKSIKGGTAELNTALGILANNGIKGAEGGTHLRNVILALQSPTDKASKCMDELGLEVYDSEGNMRSMNDILSDLNDSMSEMTSAEKNNIISTIFKKSDLASVNALLANTGDEWDSLQASITNSADAASEMADTQLDNLSGQLTILKSALESLGIAFGNILMPMVKQVVSLVQGFIEKLNNMDESQKQTIVRIGLVVAAIGPLLVVIGTVVSKIGTAMKAFSSMGTSILKVVNHAKTGTGAISKLITSIGGISAPVIAVVAVIGTLVAAFVTLWKNNDEFREKITSIWNSIKEKVTGFIDGIKERLGIFNGALSGTGSFVETLKNIWQEFCNVLAPLFELAFNTIASVLGTVLDVLTGLLDIFIGLFTGNWSQLWDGVKEIFIGIWDGIKGILTSVLDAIKGIADTVLGWFGTNWDEVWSAIKTFFTNVWDGIKSFFTNTIESIKKTANTVFTAISTFFTNILTSIKNTFSTVWNAVSSVVTTAINAVKSVITTVWNAIVSFLTPILTKIKDTISSVFNTVSTFITNIMTKIKEKISSIWSTIKSAVSDKVTGIYTTIKNGFDKAVSYITSLITKAKNWGKDLIENIIDGIKSKISAVTNAVTGVANKIKSILGFSLPETGPLADADTYMPDFMELLSSGIVSGTSKLLSKVKDTASSIGDIMTSGISMPSLNTAKSDSTSDTVTNTKSVNFGGVTIEISGAQDDKALADMVSDRINKMIKREEAVFS